MSDRIYQFLVVEDSRPDVRLFKECIKKWKARHCLYVVDDGEEALEFLRRKGNYDGAPVPDLIFLDLNMPRMDGFQVLRCIREFESSQIRGIPVIVLTSSSNPGEIQNAYALGANIYLIKPADLDEFSTMMEGLEAFWLHLATLPPPSLPPTCEANQPPQ